MKNIYETCLYHETLDEDCLVELCKAIGIVQTLEKSALDWLATNPSEDEMKRVLGKIGYDIPDAKV